MWIERTTYVTAYRFPGILKWFEVKSVSVVRRSLDALTGLFVVSYQIHKPTERFARFTGGDQPFKECHRNDGEGQRETE